MPAAGHTSVAAFARLRRYVASRGAPAARAHSHTHRGLKIQVHNDGVEGRGQGGACARMAIVVASACQHRCCSRRMYGAVLVCRRRSRPEGRRHLVPFPWCGRGLVRRVRRRIRMVLCRAQLRSPCCVGARCAGGGCWMPRGRRTRRCVRSAIGRRISRKSIIIINTKHNNKKIFRKNR